MFANNNVTLYGTHIIRTIVYLLKEVQTLIVGFNLCVVLVLSFRMCSATVYLECHVFWVV